MKIASYVAALIGLAGLTVLVLHQGLHGILHVLGLAGWALLWLVPFHALPLLLDVQAWRTLLAPRDPQRRAPLPFLFWVATVREAVNRLLPTANVGGEIVGIRLTKWRLDEGAAITASILIEVLLTLVNQYIFTALGIVLLVAATQATEQTWTILAGLALSLPLPIIAGALLRYGKVFERMEKFVERMLGDSVSLGGGSSLDAEIRALYARHGRVGLALLWQLLGFLVGSFETWLALALLGHPVGSATAIAVEATTQAVRHIIFVVPAGLGVQEAGLVLFGQIVGIDSNVALSLSLAKRMREVLFGVPALLSWQFLEGRRLKLSLDAGSKRGAASPDGLGAEILRAPVRARSIRNRAAPAPRAGGSRRRFGSRPRACTRRCASKLRHWRTASSSRQNDSDSIFPGWVRLSNRSMDMKPSIRSRRGRRLAAASR